MIANATFGGRLLLIDSPHVRPVAKLNSNTVKERLTATMREGISKKSPYLVRCFSKKDCGDTYGRILQEIYRTIGRF